MYHPRCRRLAGAGRRGGARWNILDHASPHRAGGGGRDAAPPHRGHRLLLRGKSPSPALFAEAGSAAAEEANPIADARGSAAYKKQLVKVFVTRALTAAVAP